MPEQRRTSRSQAPKCEPQQSKPGDFPEMKIRALIPLNRGKTSNVQHRTPNAEMGEDSRCHSMFGVGCSMLDVPLASWRAPFVFRMRWDHEPPPHPPLGHPPPPPGGEGWGEGGGSSGGARWG